MACYDRGSTIQLGDVAWPYVSNFLEQMMLPKTLANPSRIESSELKVPVLVQYIVSVVLLNLNGEGNPFFLCRDSQRKKRAAAMRTPFLSTIAIQEAKG